MKKEDLFGILCIIDVSGRLDFRKRLQKLTCLGKYDKEVDYPFSFEFIRYHYGPYSFELKDLMDKLITSGLVEERSVNYIYSYSLTDSGKKVLAENSNDLLKNKIKILLDKYKNQSVSQITKEAKVFYGW